MRPLVAALALLSAAAAEPQALELTVDRSASTVRYHLDHRLHPVDGRSSEIEGRAIVAPDGTARTMVRIPVASFDSGDSNRDSNMRDTLEAARHPFVVFKGVATGVEPAARGTSRETTLKGELDFHGVTRPLEVPVTLAFDADGSATVRGRFVVSLEAHAVERPSLLFVKVDDALSVELDLKLRSAR